MDAEPGCGSRKCDERDNGEGVLEEEIDASKGQVIGQKCEKDPPIVQVAAHARYSHSGEAFFCLLTATNGKDLGAGCKLFSSCDWWIMNDTTEAPKTDMGKTSKHLGNSCEE